MKERFAKLIDVKSIVTILITIAFVYGFVMGTINAEQFITIFTTIIAFYFGTQSTKKGRELSGNQDTTVQ